MELSIASLTHTYMLIRYKKKVFMEIDEVSKQNVWGMLKKCW